jgi:hypothetical protein
VRAKEIRQGVAVWVTRGGSTRPAVVVHIDNGRYWVSFTDKIMPLGASARPAALERRRP